MQLAAAHSIQLPHGGQRTAGGGYAYIRSILLHQRPAGFHRKDRLKAQPQFSRDKRHVRRRGVPTADILRAVQRHKRSSGLCAILPLRHQRRFAILYLQRRALTHPAYKLGHTPCGGKSPRGACVPGGRRIQLPRPGCGAVRRPEHREQLGRCGWLLRCEPFRRQSAGAFGGQVRQPQHPLHYRRLHAHHILLPSGGN